MPEGFQAMGCIHLVKTVNCVGRPWGEPREMYLTATDFKASIRSNAFALLGRTRPLM